MALKDIEKLVDGIKGNNDVLTLGKVDYKFNRFIHKERVRVFGFVTAIAPQLEKGNFDFFSSDGFDRIEKIIDENVTVNGSSLSKLAAHWDEYPENFIQFYTIAMQFISYPFLRGGITG